MKRFFCILLTSLLLLTGFVSCSNDFSETDTVTQDELQKLEEQNASLNQEKGEKVKVIILGDSSATWYRYPFKEEYLKERNLMGWSRYFPYYFQENVKMFSLAYGGASTRLVASSEHYNEFKYVLEEGAVVLIQFAHNELLDDERRTYAGIDYHEVDSISLSDKDGRVSYQAALYFHYIKPILDAKAIPVLLSPTVTRNRITGLAESANYTEYIQDMKELAEEFNFPFVDVSAALTVTYQNLVDEYGPEGTVRLHSYLEDTDKTLDRLHLSHEGAYLIAGIIAKEVANAVETLSVNFLQQPREFDMVIY